ncbi:hypothetical protein CARUB_v10024455mg [Capsella rubella]|uniref:Uncharacterized protein n=1 Tax=Capsella rubella TaxID=81985 RepID=R0FZK6_9BRAS|nr:hypothetical protein CARUB_v10024455mg [Capsella rubella]
MRNQKNRTQKPRSLATTSLTQHRFDRPVTYLPIIETESHNNKSRRRKLKIEAFSSDDKSKNRRRRWIDFDKKTN